MRCAERPLSHERLPRLQLPDDAVHARDLERLVQRERREDAGKPLGQHRFAGAGWPYHQQVVPAGRGNLQRALDRFLSLDVGEVRPVDILHGEQLRDVDLLRLDLLASLEERCRFSQVGDGINFKPIHDRRLGGVFSRHKHAVQSHGSRLDGDREHALDPPHGSGQRQFADHHQPVEFV